MTPSGIEQATFRFVAQHLNHCATAVPPQTWSSVSKYWHDLLTHLASAYPLYTVLNPTCHLLALLVSHHILNVSRMRAKLKLSPSPISCHQNILAFLVFMPLIFPSVFCLPNPVPLNSVNKRLLKFALWSSVSSALRNVCSRVAVRWNSANAVTYWDISWLGTRMQTALL